MKKLKKVFNNKSYLISLVLIVLIGCALVYHFFQFNNDLKFSLYDIGTKEERVEPQNQNISYEESAPITTSTEEKSKNISSKKVFFNGIVRDVMLTSYWEKPKQDRIPSFVGKVENKTILLSWNVPVENAKLTITDNNDNITKNVAGAGNYIFTEGIHGKIYMFRLEYTDPNGQKVWKNIRRVFVDFDKVSDVAILNIKTEDGKDPSFEFAKKPEGHLFGAAIKNNEYKKATLDENTPIQIKVRGNASAYGDKKSYKIVFEEKKDVLGLGEEYADKEWVLLGRSNLKTYLGLELGKALGMEWEPRMRFVNVMLNDDWKGLYVLCESVKKHPKRVNIEEDGFLIESDGYWWKQQGGFFGSHLLSQKVKFTFKYPKVISNSDSAFLETESLVKEIDDSIQNNFYNIDKIIDFDTFASWLLAHEIMGTFDSYGSNMFFYKYSSDASSKIKMGPLWDFDSIFDTKYNEHSGFWTQKTTFLPLLLQMPDFRKYYKEKYFSIAPDVENKVLAILENLKRIPGVKESYKLRTYVSLDQEIEGVKEMLHDRIEWLNQEMEKL